MIKAIEQHAEAHGDHERAAQARATLAVTHAHREQRRHTPPRGDAGCGVLAELRAFEAWVLAELAKLVDLITGQDGDGGGSPAPTDPGTPSQPGTPNRSILDGEGDEDSADDTLVRAEGAPAVTDASVNNAYDGLGDVFGYYEQVHGRDSLDGKGLPLVGVVHYGQAYDNAFWDGQAMRFGDGDGQVFGDFTGCLDVIGHELTHGVTQYTANLDYQGQSGALNEHISDVFGILVKQYRAGQAAADADWLIGEGLLAEGVKGRALRDMLHPGTAYDDPQLGVDPQPADMAHYVDTAEDDGGVHINSGIPNRAFALAATALGGHAWETVGPVWYSVLTGGHLPTSCDFAAFAAATRTAAAAVSPEVAAAVDQAWTTVGL
jgi:Zn-dependent metalloprotease